MSDPMNGDWARLDDSPAASAQMIEWHAPETAKALREAGLNAARAFIVAAPQVESSIEDAR